MWLPKDSKLQHRILKIVLDKADSLGQSNVKADKVAITLKGLAKHLKITEERLKEVIAPLVRAEEIQLNDYGNGKCVYAWNNTSIAYYEKKYLQSGKETSKRELEFIFKWIAPISLILGIFNSVQSCNKTKSDKEKIQVLQQKLNALEGKPTN
jgi:hypothetical protein